jgi:hypothetical protein
MFDQRGVPPTQVYRQRKRLRIRARLLWGQVLQLKHGPIYVPGRTLSGSDSLKSSDMESVHVWQKQSANHGGPYRTSTQTAANGDVLAVYDDKELSVYRHGDYSDRADWVNGGASGLSKSDPEKASMGQTQFWDEFMLPDDSGIGKGARIEFGQSFDKDLATLNGQANQQDLTKTAQESKLYGRFDVKNKSWFAPDGQYTGKLLNGMYASARSAGNFLAGWNGTTGTFDGMHISETTYMKLAGALQQGQFNRTNAAEILLFGKQFGPAPYYGEEGYSGRRILEGFEYGRSH